MSQPYVILPSPGSGHADEWIKLGVTAHASGNLPLAQQHYLQALRLEPNNAIATQNLAIVFAQSNLMIEALMAIERAILFDGAMGIYHMNRALMCLTCDRIDDALVSAKKALEISANAQTRLALAMIYSTAGAPELAIPLYDQVLAEVPNHPIAGPNICFAQTLTTATPKELREKRLAWHQHFGYTGDVKKHTNVKDLDRPLRIGYVGGDFKTHSAAMIFKTPVMHASPNILTYLYSSLEVSETDLNTKQFKDFAGDRWRNITALTDEQADAMIREDRIDILVDLAGHTNGGRLALFTRKPAPIQVTAWGFAHGTGCPEIDYFFADSVAIPESEREHYVETIVDLPCVVSYSPPPYDLKTTSKLPYWANDYITFGTYARYEKMNDECLRMFAEILKQVPGSKLQFKDHGCRRPFAIERCRRVMRDVDPSRLLFSIATSHHEHLLSYQQADLILDPYPHSGGVVCLEQLYMGVPLVTRYGTQASGRTTSSVLTSMNKQAWIARSSEEYVETAVAMTRQPDRLAAIRRTLHDEFMASTIMNGYAEKVEQAYRWMWQKWCRS